MNKNALHVLMYFFNNWMRISFIWCYLRIWEYGHEKYVQHNPLKDHYEINKRFLRNEENK